MVRLIVQKKQEANKSKKAGNPPSLEDYQEATHMLRKDRYPAGRETRDDPVNVLEKARVKLLSPLRKGKKRLFSIGVWLWKRYHNQVCSTLVYDRNGKAYPLRWWV
jgi:hypothetical protein